MKTVVLILIFVYAVSAQVTPSDRPEAFQAEQENLCREQRKVGERTYSFRILDRDRGDKGWYGGKKKWYRTLFPFLKTPLEKYSIDDIRYINANYNRPVPLGEAKRSKEIRAAAEAKLSRADRTGSSLQGDKLPKFDWRENGIDLGPSTDQGACNTCWAFATVDAMQASRQLDALRAGRSFATGMRPSARQLISCMAPDKVDEFCNLGWHGTAFSYMVDYGLPLGGATVYKAADNKSWTCSKEDAVKALTWDFVSVDPQNVSSNKDVKRAIVTYGPVVATLNLDSCMRLYAAVFLTKIRSPTALIT